MNFKEIIDSLTEEQKELVVGVTYELADKLNVIESMNETQKDAFISLLAKMINDNIGFEEDIENVDAV